MNDFWSADVVNMDLTGRDPGPPPSHVRVVGNADLNAFVRGLVPNVADEIISVLDEFGTTIAEPPDAWNETTDIRRGYEFTIHFDAPTQLEARLIGDAVTAFVKRRTGAMHPVFTTNIPKERI